MKTLNIIVPLLYVLLLVAGIGGLWWQAPDAAGTGSRIVMSLIIYLPLLIMGLGVVLRDKRLLTWLCFVLLFYFCGYVTQFVDPQLRWLAAIRITLVVLLFGSTVFYIRLFNKPRSTP